jgi:2-oxoglutarate ferredoxin oxidoreductase subunit gamma
MDNKFSSTRSTYGASQRGEAIFSEIILSKKPVQYPFVEDPDFYIALSHQGFQAYHTKITPQKEPVVFVESTFDYDLGKIIDDFNVIKLSTLQCAIDNGLGLNNANIVMLGSFIELTGLLSKKALNDAIQKKLSKRYLKEDLKALKLGVELAKNYGKN